MAIKAKEMVEAIEQVLMSNPGVLSVTVDGTTTQFESTSAMLNVLDYWERKAAREAGTRKRFRGVDIGSAF